MPGPGDRSRGARLSRHGAGPGTQGGAAGATKLSESAPAGEVVPVEQQLEGHRQPEGLLPKVRQRAARARAAPERQRVDGLIFQKLVRAWQVPSLRIPPRK